MVNIKPSELLIALIVFSGVMIGLSSFYIDVHNNYGVSYTSTQFNLTSFDRYNSTVSNLEGMYDKITAGKVSIATVFDLGVFFWDVAKLLATIPTLFYDLIGSFAILLHLPVWVATTVRVILIVVIIFTLIKIIFKVEV